ncbi:hypothetical protein CVT25_004968 [Psilocybe cyanescens]|uniref:Uncharacterized protein n=1 Tax=Psilocybe cyanescens TaxID=93625 RepID=A0A409XUD6_PSICY|nr:hypothetical protein CVT25_004968 [Psilocybe cyanescens]
MADLKVPDTDILYVNIAGSPVAVINSYKTAMELLENRSSMYSGRSRMPMISELELMHHIFQRSVVHKIQPQRLKGQKT